MPGFTGPSGKSHTDRVLIMNLQDLLDHLLRPELDRHRLPDQIRLGRLPEQRHQLRRRHQLPRLGHPLPLDRRLRDRQPKIHRRSDGPHLRRPPRLQPRRDRQRASLLQGTVVLHPADLRTRGTSPRRGLLQEELQFLLEGGAQQLQPDLPRVQMERSSVRLLRVLRGDRLRNGDLLRDQLHPREDQEAAGDGVQHKDGAGEFATGDQRGC